MTIFKTAYDTTATSGFRIEKTVDAIQKASIGSELQLAPNQYIRAVQGGGSVVDNVPQFEHPMWIEGVDNVNYIAYDVRPFGKIDKFASEFQVRNSIEYDTATLRAKLNYIWMTESPNILRDISQLPVAVFSSWIAESVTRRFVLDPEEQLRLSILAAYHYQCLFTDAKELDANERNRMGSAISRAIGVAAEQVFDVIDDLPVLQNISDFCAHAQTVTQSVRLQELNSALLITLLGGTWFGHNHKEMVAVALEHPPTWLAILVACYQSRTFKNSQIAKIAENKNRSNAGQNYVRSVIKMTTDLIGN